MGLIPSDSGNERFSGDSLSSQTDNPVYCDSESFRIILAFPVKPFRAYRAQDSLPMAAAPFANVGVSGVAYRGISCSPLAASVLIRAIMCAIWRELYIFRFFFPTK